MTKITLLQLLADDFDVTKEGKDELSNFVKLGIEHFGAQGDLTSEDVCRQITTDIRSKMLQWDP